MSQITKIRELVAKLPLELQPYASHYVELLLNFQTSEIAALLDLAVGGDIKLAYQMLVAKMSTEELLDEMDRLNLMLIQQNKDAKAEGEYLKNFLNVAIVIGIAAL